MIFQKARQQIARAAWIDLIHHLVEELVVDRQIALAEFLRENLEPEARRRFGARGVLREDHRRGVDRRVPGISEQRQPLRASPAIGKLRYVSLPTRTPASFQEPDGVNSTISDPPWLM